MEILIGVIVVHIKGHIEIYPAQSFYDLTHSLPLNNHIEVRHNAGKILHLGLEAIHPQLGGINRVDLLDIPGHVDHGIPGNAHEAYLLIGYVVGSQHNGIGTAAGGILSQEKECKVIFLSPACSSWLIAFFRQGFLIIFCVRAGGFDFFADIRRLYKDRPCSCHDHRQGHHTSQGNGNCALPSGKAAALLPLRAVGSKRVSALMPLLPLRLTLSFLSAHDMIPFK